MEDMPDMVDVVDTGETLESWFLSDSLDGPATDTWVVSMLGRADMVMHGGCLTRMYY